MHMPVLDFLFLDTAYSILSIGTQPAYLEWPWTGYNMPRIGKYR